MKIVFLGTPSIAVPSLRALDAAGHDVRLVITRPDRPVGRSGRPTPPPIKRAAVELGIDVHQPTKVRNRAFLEEISRREPDVLAVVAYGRILTAPVLEVAPQGAVNVHFSLLPSYRGAAPVQWALANGESRTGVTTMKINERMDEGDILLQREIAIGDDEHTPGLQERLASVGAELLVRTLADLAAGAITPRPQDHAIATHAPIIRAEDGEVDPGLTAAAIAGRVRGFDPWPGVWFSRGGRRIRVLEASSVGNGVSGREPGEVLELDGDGLLVVCGEGTLLRVTRVQPEGRRAMSARDAVNGRQLGPGDRLEQAGGDR